MKSKLLILVGSISIYAIYIISCTPIDKILMKDEYPIVLKDDKSIIYSHNIYNGNGNNIQGLYMVSVENQINKIQIFQNQLLICSDLHPFENKILSNLGIINFDNNNFTFSPKDIAMHRPKWSSDGKTILFRDFNKICLMDSLFENKRILFYGLDPNWTPDDKIIFYSYEKQGLCITDTLNKEIFKLTNDKNDCYVSFSPDGTKIIWNRMEEIWIMNSDGTNQQFLTDGVHPSWFPDSKSIIYSKSDHKKYTSYFLWKINIDTKNKTQLTN